MKWNTQVCDTFQWEFDIYNGVQCHTLNIPNFIENERSKQQKKTASLAYSPDYNSVHNVRLPYIVMMIEVSYVHIYRTHWGNTGFFITNKKITRNQSSDFFFFVRFKEFRILMHYAPKKTDELFVNENKFIGNECRTIEFLIKKFTQQNWMK